MGSATSSMATKFAFFPPNPPSYKVSGGDELRFAGVRWRDDVDVVRVPTKRGNEIIVIYDYSGYGQSSGKVSEKDTYADIEAAYKCLEGAYGAKQEDVVLYGQSLGSGPTLELAIRLPRLRAVILHSPILSGLRVVYPVKMTFWFDIYKNIDKIGLVRCPVLVIHGTADDVVDFLHDKKLWQLCKEMYEPLWVEGGSHCDLETRPEYLSHIKKFVSTIEKMSRPLDAPEVQTPNALVRSPSTVQKEKGWFRTGSRRERSRLSLDSRISSGREKSRTSTDRRDRSSNSVDCSTRARDSTDQPERARKSFDRFGDMVRAVGLCNVDCLKQAAISDEGKSL